MAAASKSSYAVNVPFELSHTSTGLDSAAITVEPIYSVPLISPVYSASTVLLPTQNCGSVRPEQAVLFKLAELQRVFALV